MGGTLNNIYNNVSLALHLHTDAMTRLQEQVSTGSRITAEACAADMQTRSAIKVLTRILMLMSFLKSACLAHGGSKKGGKMESHLSLNLDVYTRKVPGEALRLRPATVPDH